jgi:cell fate regulator YaaT (PSP1 superfamily)
MDRVCLRESLVAEHFVRVGALGVIGRFVAADNARYSRRTRVVCRTKRGLEVGEVLAGAEANDLNAAVALGTLLRRLSVEDELLLVRLERHRHAAWEACSRLIEERNIPAVLIDVETLFDGSTLIFYFLGEVTAEVEALTADLAETYESKVQFRKFAETLEEGCGPGCGTEEAAGCGTGCASCAVAAACHK